MLDHECIAADLQRQGYSVLPAGLETSVVNALRAELAAQPQAFRKDLHMTSDASV